MEAMRYLEILNTISTEQLRRLSDNWKRFLSSFSGVIVEAKYIAQINSLSIVTAAAVAFAVKAIVAQSERDDKVERLVRIMADLYSYFNDADQIKLVMTYRRTLAHLLNQTSECAHFIGNYGKITSFAQRAMVHMVSDADEMINRFEQAFGELKVELIMGSSLQTAVVSFRILQKVSKIESLLYIGFLPYLKRAMWDTSRCCLPGTREDVIKDIVEWTSNLDGRHESRLYLLAGPEGSGKSSIAHTVARTFHQVKRLGAAVFTHDCTDQRVDAQAITSTIAFQLANYDDTIRHRMAKLIETNTHLLSADVSRQFHDLIVASVWDLTMIGPVIIIVDGLSDPAEQNKLLAVLTRESSNLPLNFRILLTSRYEKLASNIAESTNFHRIRVIKYEDHNEGTSNIEAYISRSFDILFDAKPTLQEHFIIAELTAQFTSRAFRLHLWATTAFRWLSTCPDDIAVSFIQFILLDDKPLTMEKAMDNVYHAVLQVLPDRISAYQGFEAMIKSEALSHTLVDKDLDQEYFGLVVKVEHPWPKAANMFRLHPSFEDFLTDPRRCDKKFLVQRALPTGLSLLGPCLDQLVNGALRPNVCDLADAAVQNNEIPERDERIQRSIPESLRYACRNWVYHLELAGNYISPLEVQSVIGKVEKFLFSHLLHWIEVMSILGESGLALSSLRRLSLWLKRQGVPTNQRLSVIIREAILFIRSFFDVISKAALQTYFSALTLMPSDTLLFETYGGAPGDIANNIQSGWVIINDPQRSSMPGLAQYSAFASYRYLLACAETSPKQRICFYDSRSGQRIGVDIPLINVSSLDFSGNDRHIAAVGPEFFGIWDVMTGAQIRSINAAPTWPSAVFLSSDGNLVARSINTSPSTFDVLAWDVKTEDRLPGVKLKCCKNQGFRVPVVLSPDGKMIVGPTARDGQSVQFLDIKTAVPPLVHPSDPRSNTTPNGSTLFKAAFWSLDSSLLAAMTCSDDRAQVWSLIDRQSKRESELEGTCSGLKWLAFSPDNSCIAALQQDPWQKKSSECTAAIWDTYTGKRMWSKKLNLEPGWVHEWRHCISFLPDGHEVFFFTGLHGHPVRVVRMPGHMAYPPTFYKNPRLATIQYTQVMKEIPLTFADKVDKEGWICDSAGKRRLWVPYPAM
ncbi:hypothetical protein CVT26_004599 [Gymnopilus dilepis]|uniref:Nephrocystin 3-like N-terminal domain-containing protein n=1 Tax=Gymnopilus dilepis TaxID=231916 RepID=A0A409WC51_9AGAR|nr:hypothetical protein CVT26_004599 [Gymnopilus dilepis]